MENHTYCFGNANYCSPLTFSNKIKYTFTMWFNKYSLCYLLIWMGILMFSKKICKGKWKEALFITAEIWKPPRYPSAEWWINKLWYTQAMGNWLLKINCYQTIKKDRNINPHDQVKEANLKRLHRIWFELNYNVEKVKSWIQ